MCLGQPCQTDEDRRTFLIESAVALTGVAMLGVNAYAGEGKARPPTRVLDDPKIKHGSVTFKSGDETIDGYVAQPKAPGKYPAVIVVAGNRITEEYIPNTCAALAVAGFVGLAPNIFHTLPDSARTPEEMRKALEGRTEDDDLRDLHGGARYLASHEAVRPGGIGILGFCAGGRRALRYGARHAGEVRAVVPFHPGKTSGAEMTGLKAPVEIHCGTADRHVPVAEIRQLESDLNALRVPVEVYLYEGCDHGFLAYTRPYYNPEAAKLAWKRTVKFLSNALKA